MNLRNVRRLGASASAMLGNLPSDAAHNRKRSQRSAHSVSRALIGKAILDRHGSDRNTVLEQMLPGS